MSVFRLFKSLFHGIFQERLFSGLKSGFLSSFQRSDLSERLPTRCYTRLCIPDISIDSSDEEKSLYNSFLGGNCSAYRSNLSIIVYYCEQSWPLNNIPCPFLTVCVQSSSIRVVHICRNYWKLVHICNSVTPPEMIPHQLKIELDLSHSARNVGDLFGTKDCTCRQLVRHEWWKSPRSVWLWHVFAWLDACEYFCISKLLIIRNSFILLLIVLSDSRVLKWTVCSSC